MVAVRMDDRLLTRVDPSDVVQEAMVDAVRKLPEYLRERPLPFYPWLRQIAWNRLIDLHREHVKAGRRSVNREIPFDPPLSSQSQYRLADQILSRECPPNARILRDELISRLQQSIARLAPTHREILILRHIEGLSVPETAQILKTTESAVTSRHFRALVKLREILDRDMRS
jgi:RNA polymerase sigma-70 factor (ECF subfamily)